MTPEEFAKVFNDLEKDHLEILVEPVTTADEHIESSNLNLDWIQKFNNQYGGDAVYPNREYFITLASRAMSGLEEVTQIDHFQHLLQFLQWKQIKIDSVTRAMRLAFANNTSEVDDREGLKILFDNVVHKAFDECGKAEPWFEHNTILRKSWIKLLLRCCKDEQIIISAWHQLPSIKFIKAFEPALVQYVVNHRIYDVQPACGVDSPNLLNSKNILNSTSTITENPVTFHITKDVVDDSPNNQGKYGFDLLTSFFTNLENSKPTSIEFIPDSGDSSIQFLTKKLINGLLSNTDQNSNSSEESTESMIEIPKDLTDVKSQTLSDFSLKNQETTLNPTQCSDHTLLEFIQRSFKLTIDDACLLDKPSLIKFPLNSEPESDLFRTFIYRSEFSVNFTEMYLNQFSNVSVYRKLLFLHQRA